MISLGRYIRYTARHLALREIALPLFTRSSFLAAQTRASGTTSPVVTNTKYAGEKCFAPPAALRHFLGSPASPGRITVRRNKRAAHYFYESPQYFPGGVGGPLSRVFLSSISPVPTLRRDGSLLLYSFSSLVHDGARRQNDCKNSLARR